MNNMFLDPNKPLHTCEEDSCESCSIPGKPVCHFNGKQLTLFLLMILPLFIFAGYSIHTFKPLIFILWIIFIVLYFGLIEIRAMCSHCPHYAEPDTNTLKCWANYGSPKLWEYRPGPMTWLEKSIFLLGLMFILLPPVAIFILQSNIAFAIIYLALLALWKFALKKLYCSHCINFACPFNAVDEKSRKMFLEKNKDIKNAWKV